MCAATAMTSTFAPSRLARSKPSARAASEPWTVRSDDDRCHRYLLPLARPGRSEPSRAHLTATKPGQNRDAWPAGARRSFGRILGDQHRGLVVARVSDVDDAEAAAADVDRVAGLPGVDTETHLRRSAGVPSGCSRRKVNVTRGAYPRVTARRVRPSPRDRSFQHRPPARETWPPRRRKRPGAWQRGSSPATGGIVPRAGEVLPQSCAPRTRRGTDSWHRP